MIHAWFFLPTYNVVFYIIYIIIFKYRIFWWYNKMWLHYRKNCCITQTEKLKNNYIDSYLNQMQIGIFLYFFVSSWLLAKNKRMKVVYKIISRSNNQASYYVHLQLIFHFLEDLVFIICFFNNKSNLL